MNAIIIDDEKHCTKTLQWSIEQYCPEITIVATATNGIEGKQCIEMYKPALVFLDIEMPIMNGIEFIQSFNEINFEVIFTTA